MPKDKWRIYATKNRLEQKGYFKKHCHRGKCGKTTKTGSSNSLQQSREIEEKKIGAVQHEKTEHVPAKKDSEREVEVDKELTKKRVRKAKATQEKAMKIKD